MYSIKKKVVFLGLTFASQGENITISPPLFSFCYSQSYMDRRKLEVRKRIMEQTQRKKKGFMTPERKKKLRVSDD